MKHLTLSLRNLLRNKRRTLLLISILVFGITGILTYAGYSNFYLWGLRENTINNSLGHIPVYRRGYNPKGVHSYPDYLIMTG